MFAGSPDDKHHKDPVKFAADYTKYFDDSGKRTAAIVGAYLVMLACIAMVVFALHLRDRLAASGAPGAGRLTFAGSILFAALTMVGALAYAWVPGAVAFGNVPVPKGELAYLAPQLAFGFLLVGGMAAAALMLIAGGAAAARTQALPKWLGWAGVVVGVIVFLTGCVLHAGAAVRAVGARRRDRVPAPADAGDGLSVHTCRCSAADPSVLGDAVDDEQHAEHEVERGHHQVVVGLEPAPPSREHRAGAVAEHQRGHQRRRDTRRREQHVDERDRDDLRGRELGGAHRERRGRGHRDVLGVERADEEARAGRAVPVAGW